MPIVVHAMEEAEYETWLEERKAAAEQEAMGIDREWALDELMARGETVYQSICSSCHQSEGQGAPPAFPALAGNDQLIDDQDWHLDRVINGVSGGGHARFSKYAQSSRDSRCRHVHAECLGK